MSRFGTSFDYSGILILIIAPMYRNNIVIDSHCDTPGRAVDGIDLNERSQSGHYDFPRMIEGGVDAAFFAIYTSNRLGEVQALKRAFSMIAAVCDNISRSGGSVRQSFCADDIRRNASEGVLSVVLGMENGDPLNSDLSFLRQFHRMGVRYLTLTHTGHNSICDSSSPESPCWHGLSPFGIKVVKEMNRLGMIIDVSHISDESFYDVIKYSEAPVVATHSCCRALADAKRNMDDGMIKALADRGGVIQINFYPAFLSPEYAAKMKDYYKYEEMESAIKAGLVSDEKKKAEMISEISMAKKRLAAIGRPSYKVVADHVEHAARVAGIEHVGLGSDFDGIDICPDGLEDVSKFHMVLDELKERGYSDNEIGLVAGGNFLRVMKQVCG